MISTPEAWQQVYNDQREEAWQQAIRSAPLFQFALKKIAVASAIAAVGCFIYLSFIW